MSGSKFLGFKVDFTYSTKIEERMCKISMPGYRDVAAALKPFEISVLIPTHSAEDVVPINYGSKEAQLVPTGDSGPLDPAGLLRLQQINGTILMTHYS